MVILIGEGGLVCLVGWWSTRVTKHGVSFASQHQIQRPGIHTHEQVLGSHTAQQQHSTAAAHHTQRERKSLFVGRIESREIVSTESEREARASSCCYLLLNYKVKTEKRALSRAVLPALTARHEAPRQILPPRILGHSGRRPLRLTGGHSWALEPPPSQELRNTSVVLG